MTGNITWEMVFALFALFGAIGAVWRRFEFKIKEAEQAATLRALEATTKVDITTTELAKYKLHVAETYATKDGTARQFEAVSKSITEFGERMEKRLDGMNERLDRVIEAGQRSSSRRTPN